MRDRRYPRAMTAKPMNAAEWTLLLSLSAIWGMSFFFVAVALKELPFVWVAVARVALAAAMLHLAARAMRLRYPRDGATWARFAVLGLVNNAIPFGLIFWAQTAIPSGLAAILNACTPLFAMVLAHFVTRDERLSARRLLGVMIGIAGVAAMMGLQILDRIGTELWAQVAMLGAGLSYAIAGLYGRRLRHLPPMATAAGRMTPSSYSTGSASVPSPLLSSTMSWPKPGLPALNRHTATSGSASPSSRPTRTWPRITPG